MTRHGAGRGSLALIQDATAFGTAELPTANRPRLGMVRAGGVQPAPALLALGFEVREHLQGVERAGLQTQPRLAYHRRTDLPSLGVHPTDDVPFHALLEHAPVGKIRDVFAHPLRRKPDPRRNRLVRHANEAVLPLVGAT